MNLSGLPFSARARIADSNARNRSGGNSITLPYPPALNHLYATVRGRRVLSRAGRQFKEAVAWQALTDGWTPVDGPVAVTVNVYRPQRRGDLDGSFKVLLDSLSGVLYRDDSQVVELHAYRHDDKHNPRVEVTVAAVPQEAP